MSAYIKSYKLLNFQSWNDESAEISLETDMVNIIEGANETGKSVLYKVLYNFCFPGYWAPTELIRRGCSAGILLLQLDDDATIIYALKPASYTYILVEPDGSKTEWTNQGCPDAIIARMGLILDKETKIILNIIDSDVALPFIKTSPVFNASLIRAIVEPESMTRFFQNLADTTTKVDNAYRYFGSKAATLHEQLVNIPLIDPIDMENQKAVIDRLIDIAEALNAVEYKVDLLFQLMRVVITEVEDPAGIENDIQMYDSLAEIDSELNSLYDCMIADVPEVRMPEHIEDDIHLLDGLAGLYKQCSSMEVISMQTPVEVAYPDVDEAINTLDDLAGILHDISAVGDILCKAPIPVEFVDVMPQIQILQSAGQCVMLLESMTTEFSSLQLQQQTLDQLKMDIDDIAARVGVCPTCGQLLGGKNDTCIHNS